jgi:cyclopropane fatty-acyl-phospholipid synthase-like methyltransferase
MRKRCRPEDASGLDAAAYYDEATAERYTHGVVWNAGTQAAITATACVLANVSGSSCVLDLGCGSGLSSRAILLAAPDCCIIGFDISRPMLNIAAATVAPPEFCESDLRQGLALRSAPLFESVVSISALQWLMGTQTAIDVSPLRLLLRDVHAVMTDHARFAIQAYFDGPAVATAAMDACKSVGFSAVELVMDFPLDHHNRKYFLCGMKGGSVMVRHVVCVCLPVLERCWFIIVCSLAG